MDRTPAEDRDPAMDRTSFRERLRALEADDREGLVDAIRTRVQVLAARHADIGDRIRASEERGRALGERLANVEAEIVARADAAVEEPVESLEDVESLPVDAAVEFDPSLVAEVDRLRAAARENSRATAEEGSALRAELSGNAEELERCGEVLAAVEAGEMTADTGRDRLLAWLDDGPGKEGTGGDGRSEEGTGGDGRSEEGTGGDGRSEEGTGGDGRSEEGTGGDGRSEEGTGGDGRSEEGAGDDGRT